MKWSSLILLIFAVGISTSSARKNTKCSKQNRNKIQSKNEASPDFYDEKLDGTDANGSHDRCIIPANTTESRDRPEDDDSLGGEEIDPCDIPEINSNIPDDVHDFQEKSMEVRRALHGNFIAKIWKVRTCNNWFCFRSSLSRSQFSFWESARVSNGNQKDTYIGILREPPVSDVNRLVLLIAGQSGFANNVGKGIGDMISGSHYGWHDNWSKTTQSDYHEIRHSSWAHEYFHHFGSDTFIATSFSAAFNWGTSAGEKQDIEDAFYNWLLSKVNNSNLDEVILAGHSRGGCLALRLAARFNRDPALTVDVAVMSADPVCMVSQREFGARNSKITNPLNNMWAGVTTDMRSQFREGRDIYVQNYVVGDDTFVINSIRGLSDKRALATSFNMGGWYQQEWITWGHTAADDWSLSYSPVEFYEDAHLWFNGKCDNPCPFGGMYNSVHCYVGSPPAGTKAFIWGGNYYYTPLVPNSCPRTNSYYDGANCLVSVAEGDPFIWSNNWYYHPVWDDVATCDAKWSRWYDRDDPSLNGDFERLQDHRNMANPPCVTPIDIQCHTVIGNYDAWSTGDIIRCEKDFGLNCVSSLQPSSSGRCQYDYKVRYLCP